MSRILLIIISVLLYSCMGSTMQTSLKSEQNRDNIVGLRLGMTQEDVLTLMGSPYKSEVHKIENNTYVIYFYVTEPTVLGQSKLIEQNFTPVVFKDNILVGWGTNYYNYLMDIDNAREKYEEEKRQKYTDDRDEWPPNQHVVIPPPSEKANDQSLEEDLDKTIPQPDPQPQEEKPQGTGPCKNKPKTDENYNMWE